MEFRPTLLKVYVRGDIQRFDAIDYMMEILRIIKKTISLDIIDLNYGFSSERLSRLSGTEDTKPDSGYVRRLGNFFLKMCASLIKSIRTEQERIPKGANLFFVDTKNQRDSLSPVAKKINNGWFVGNGGNAQVSQDFPLFWAYFCSLPFFPLFVWKFYKSTDYTKKSFKYNIDYYWLTYGYFIMAVYWLRRLNPRVIIVSNDHNMPNRVIVSAARFTCIPTIYIQHASVNKLFPPLSFDFAFLDGTKALQAYDEAGTSTTKVFLIGTPKFDNYYVYINRHTELKSIGVCTNIFDPLDRAEEVCRELSINFPDLMIFLRPHPGDERRHAAWRDLAKAYRLHFSDPVTELSFDFLRKCEAIIVGDSNILLEAALINVYPFYYDFSQSNWDWYGFCANGLAEYFDRVGKLCERIQSLIYSKPDVRSRCLPYCCTVGGKYDGHSTDLAVSLIDMLLRKDHNYGEDWKRISTVSLEAYQLVDG